jgi:hypothetical protein
MGEPGENRNEEAHIPTESLRGEPRCFEEEHIRFGKRDVGDGPGDEGKSSGCSWELQVIGLYAPTPYFHGNVTPD